MWVKTQMGGLVNLHQFASVQVQKLRTPANKDFFVLAFAVSKDYEILFKGSEDDCKAVLAALEIAIRYGYDICNAVVTPVGDSDDLLF